MLKIKKIKKIKLSARARYRIIIGLLTAVIIFQWVSMSPRPKKIIKAMPVIKGKIAIVLDDWGYNLNTLSILDGIKYPLTMSVLPNLSYSQDAASKLHAKGFEVILHLPMEPYEKVGLEKNTIMTASEEESIKQIIGWDLESIFYAQGVSNHMGSKATGDKKTMETVLRELKKRKLYFLDSLSSPKSICSVLARGIGIRFAKRDVFLDNKEDAAYIAGQIDRLRLRAEAYGQAIGIGHDRKLTLEVLKEVMPQLARQGYKFVFVSELTR